MGVESPEKMYLVKDAVVQYQPMGDPADPDAPTSHLVILQIRCEVGKPENLQASPVMFLKPDRARELGQRLIREAKAATESALRTNYQKKHH